MGNVQNIAVLAFLGEMIASYLHQFGLIMQKLAHRHVES